jgi:GTPase SAR1 family protein
MGNCRLYRHADVFLLCYKINEPATLVSALNTWRKEIAAQARTDASIVLVGLQSDLR